MLNSFKSNSSGTPTWRKYSSFFYYALLVIYLCAKHASAAIEEVNGGEEKVLGRYQVAKFNFDHVSDVYAITLWILLGSLAKVGFHLSHKLTEKFPESCLLIILGLVVGGLLYATKLAEQKAYVLNSDTFFLFLLPPIILEAGYFMPNRPFFDNIGTILLFAIANTLFNTILIGLTLWGFSFTSLYGGTEFEMLHCFVFAALVSAVDPVAVLATFVEIHVNDMLYIVVFGESLLNDAVSVVLYRMFDAFAEMGQDNIMAVDIVLGCTSFFIVAIGGVLIGIIFGVIACFTTKFTEHTPVLEPLIILTYSYLSYLTAEMFNTSGILAITFCGMFMKQYVEFNISKKSNASIEFVLKMLASIMETIIFMFMGLSTVSDHHSWNTGFVFITLAACSIYRIIGVIIFANLANRWRLLELKMTDMLIMSYGGIRGAVAFALALILDESKIPRKKEFVTATIAVVFFTVFLQGTTIGPIVKYFKVKRKETEEPTMSAKLTNRLVDHIMSCLEDIAGVAGKNSLRDKIRGYDRRFLKPLLLREKLVSRDEKLLSTFKKINELNVSKMAENPEFVFPSSASMAQFSSMQNMRNISVSNLLASGLNEVSTVPDFQILGTQPSKRADEDARYHHLLDSVMYDPRKRQTIHKRTQLNEEHHHNRKPKKYNSTAAAPSSKNFHHQNPFVLRTLIDQDHSKSIKNMGSRRPSGPRITNMNRDTSGSHISRSAAVSTVDKSAKSKSASAHVHTSSEDRSKASKPDQTQQSTNEERHQPSCDQNAKQKEGFYIPDNESTPPPSPTNDNIIPPPWKSTLNDTTNDEPIKAHMPSWANNPNYTLHATTTKPNESTHKAVFEIFEDISMQPASAETARSSSESESKNKDSKKPTTRL